MDNVDDLVLDNIIRHCTSRTRANLACVCRRYKEAVRRVDRMYGRGVVVKEYTYHEQIKGIRQHPTGITSCVATKVPLHRLPVTSMTNLRVLRLGRVHVNLRDVLAIRDLPLKTLEIAHVTRCFYQHDRFRLSTLNHIRYVHLSFDDTWNGVVLDDLGVMRTLIIRCRKGSWTRQPYVCIDTVGNLDHLSVSSYNKPRIDESIQTTNLRSLYVHCHTLKSMVPIYRLLGQYTHTVELHAQTATVFTHALFRAAPNLQCVRIRVHRVMHSMMPLVCPEMSVFCDTYTSQHDIPQPDSLICLTRLVL